MQTGGKMMCLGPTKNNLYKKNLMFDVVFVHLKRTKLYVIFAVRSKTISRQLSVFCLMVFLICLSWDLKWATKGNFIISKQKKLSLLYFLYIGHVLIRDIIVVLSVVECFFFPPPFSVWHLTEKCNCLFVSLHTHILRHKMHWRVSVPSAMPVCFITFKCFRNDLYWLMPRSCFPFASQGSNVVCAVRPRGEEFTLSGMRTHNPPLDALLCMRADMHSWIRLFSLMFQREFSHFSYTWRWFWRLD